MLAPLLGIGGALAVVAALAVLAFGAFAGDRGGDQGSIDQSQVKINANQAQAAATQSIPGTVQGTRLENEDGTTAYAVTIKRSDGTVVTADVSAGNGQVFRQDNGPGESGDDDGG